MLMELHAEALSLDNRGHRGQLRTGRAAAKWSQAELDTGGEVGQDFSHWQMLLGPPRRFVDQKTTYGWWRLDKMMSVCYVGVMELGFLGSGLYAGSLASCLV